MLAEALSVFLSGTTRTTTRGLALVVLFVEAKPLRRIKLGLTALGGPAKLRGNVMSDFGPVIVRSMILDSGTKPVREGVARGATLESATDPSGTLVRGVLLCEYICHMRKIQYMQI